ncbi:MAG TPA: hypothetical protein VNI60_09340 [Pyrinomonadaceae bacterium]|nr:hypothetical protein [Pyrinomonadaceae bacterium]
MAPKVEPNRINQPHRHDNPPHRNIVKPPVSKPPVNDVGATNRSELKTYGNQQRERIERLYGAGAAVL